MSRFEKGPNTKGPLQASQSLPTSPKQRTDARGAAQLRSADNSPLCGRDPGHDPDSPRTPISLMGSSQEDFPPVPPVDRSDNPPSGGDMASALMMGGPPPVDLASGKP